MWITVPACSTQTATKHTLSVLFEMRVWIWGSWCRCWWRRSWSEGNSFVCLWGCLYPSCALAETAPGHIHIVSLINTYWDAYILFWHTHTYMHTGFISFQWTTSSRLLLRMRNALLKTSLDGPIGSNGGRRNAPDHWREKTVLCLPRWLDVFFKVFMHTCGMSEFIVPP